MFCALSLNDAIKKNRFSDWFLVGLIWGVSIITIVALFKKWLEMW